MGSGGGGTIQRGPFLMARSSLSRAWAAASRTGVLWGSRMWCVEGKGGEQDKEEQTLTVTCSQHARPQNGRLQGLTARAQRACVHLHKRAVWVRAQCLRHSRSANKLVAGRRRCVLAHTALRQHSTGEHASHRSNHPPKGTTMPKGGGRSSPIHDVSHPRAGVTRGMYLDSIWWWWWHGNVSTAGRPASPGGHQTIGTLIYWLLK